MLRSKGSSNVQNKELNIQTKLKGNERTERSKYQTVTEWRSQKYNDQHKENEKGGKKSNAFETQGKIVTRKIRKDLTKRSFLEGETFFKEAC